MNNLDYGEHPEEKQENLLKEANIGNLAGEIFDKSQF